MIEKANITPPQRNAVIASLRSREAELRGAGVAALYLFGSAASGQATSVSDVDLFFDQSNPEDFDLVDLIDVSDRIAEVLGGYPVDLATRGSLHPALRPAIEAGAVRVF